MNSKTRKILNRKWRGLSWRWNGKHFASARHAIFAREAAL